MKKVIRVILAIIFISCGLSVAIFSILLQLSSFNWGAFWTYFLPVGLFALTLLIAGVEILRGATWRDIVDFLTNLIGL